jgi:hypothetical protein
LRVALGTRNSRQYRALKEHFAWTKGVGPAGWQNDFYDLLRRNDVTPFAYVPDAGHRILIDRSLADPAAHSVALTDPSACRDRFRVALLGAG